jgi:hypothetical protein
MVFVERPNRPTLLIIMADLITVQEYKNAEGIANAKDDSRLDIIVPQVSDLPRSIAVLHLLIIIVVIKPKLFQLTTTLPVL